jgi:phosphonate ABC transporter permease subunit PhnE
MEKKKSIWKSLQLGLGVLVIMVVYAYGFEITNVNLEELQSERRQNSLVRVMRALAQPEIFEYEQAEQVVNFPFYVTCPPEGTPIEPELDTSNAYITVSPTCAEPGEIVTVEGFNFAANVSGPVRFVPGSDPTNLVSIGRDTVTTDGSGYFSLQFEVPKRPSEEVQYVRATLRENVGLPRFTRTAHETWDKIIETVFLALLATTVGTLLAIPLSFIAARNLMKPVRSPLTSVSLSTLGLPVGMMTGFYVVDWISKIAAPLTGNLITNIAVVSLVPVGIWFATRWAMPPEELTVPPLGLRMARMLVLSLATIASFFWLFHLSGLTSILGRLADQSLGSIGFMGNFLYQLSDILKLLVPSLGALAAGFTLSSFLGRLGQRISEKLTGATLKVLNLVLAAAAGATIFLLFGALIEWLYQIGRPEYTYYIPGGIGAGLGLLLAMLTKAKDTLPVGMVIYTVTRTLLNGLRSIEALVMAIVFVIAVGIGPFAGVLALGLHTIVSLAKLYSEQVESIAAGPLEAIEATGANRLQTIIYAVIPQIVPPYISYTMYRWDINVRMSTIIGFVGGGGIGFLLQQNINLLNYRAAAAQMLAIAVVVSLMDYISSEMRERVV